MHNIYVIRNTLNLKLYVGQTVLSLKKRFARHVSDKKKSCRKLANALKKHGSDNFSIELIAMCSDQDTANYLEICFIDEFNSIKTGYNIREGGSHGRASKETRKKMSLVHTGKHHSKETIEKMSLSQMGDKNHRYGKTASSEYKKKLSKARQGKRPAAKLNWDMVAQIRAEYLLVKNYSKLAKKYGVSLNSIKNIVLNKTWSSK